MPNTNDYYQKREDPYKPKFTRNVNRPLTFFLVIVALVFIMSVFFKVSRIEVKGNSIYTADEVIKASGIETGDNLFFINGIAAGSRVAVKLPYVDSVQINRGLPNLVTIVVTESKAVGCLNVGDELWSVNSNGKFQLDVELLIEKHELKFDYTIQSLQIKISHYFDSITYELLFLICNGAEQVLFAGYLKNYT